MNEFDNRIDQKFQELQACGKKALIAFLTAGDPDYNTTEQTVLEMQRKAQISSNWAYRFPIPLPKAR